MGPFCYTSDDINLFLEGDTFPCERGRKGSKCDQCADGYKEISGVCERKF